MKRIDYTGVTYLTPRAALLARRRLREEREGAWRALRRAALVAVLGAIIGGGIVAPLVALHRMTQVTAERIALPDLGEDWDVECRTLPYAEDC